MIKLKPNVILFNVIVTQKLRRKKYQTGKQSQWIRLACEYGKQRKKINKKQHASLGLTKQTPKAKRIV